MSQKQTRAFGCSALILRAVATVGVNKQLDDTSSYGPETVTITLDSSLVQDGGVFDITENGIETVNEFYNEYVATGVR